MTVYGSQEWFDKQYGAATDDPWGLDWRPTQLYRYGTMIGRLLEEIRAIDLYDGLIVDIGCATGGFTCALNRALADTGEYQLVGVDLSKTAIERARQRSSDIEFQVGSLEDIAKQFRSSASIVIFLEVLYYTPQERRAEAIEFLKSIIKPGGLLLISTMIGRPPYLGYEELVQTVGRQFAILSGGCLNLWPLVFFEKIWLKLAKPDGLASQSHYLPGQTGYNCIDRFARICSDVFGRHAQSHAYLLARS